MTSGLSRGRLRRVGAGVAVIAGIVAAAVVPNGAGAATNGAATDGAATNGAATVCRNVAVPTKVGSTRGVIAGTLCTPPNATTLQVLIHGWTYNRSYFDVGVQPERYSYARAANKAGYATLAIDRMGAGASLHPLSVFGTVQADIRTVHEVVQAARRGAFGTPFGKVVTVGHSLGSIIAQGEAGIYRDVDAVITTGFSSAINQLNSFILIAGHGHPATADPRFARSKLDPLYLTSIPGTRVMFTNPANTDPALHAYDEAALKDTNSLVEGATLFGYPFTNAISRITVPVLAVTGTKDPFFCGLNSADCTSSATLLAHERTFYTAGNVVEAFAVPNTGHNVQLERTAPLATRWMLAFVDRYVGPGTGERDTAAGVRPAPLPAPAGTPSAVDTLVNAAFLHAVMPASDAYGRLTRGVPGLGDTTNPDPAAARVLSLIAKTVSGFVPSGAQTLLGN